MMGFESELGNAVVVERLVGGVRVSEVNAKHVIWPGAPYTFIISKTFARGRHSLMV